MGRAPATYPKPEAVRCGEATAPRPGAVRATGAATGPIRGSAQAVRQAVGLHRRDGVLAAARRSCAMDDPACGRAGDPQGWSRRRAWRRAALCNDRNRASWPITAFWAMFRIRCRMRNQSRRSRYYSRCTFHSVKRDALRRLPSRRRHRSAMTGVDHEGSATLSWSARRSRHAPLMGTSIQSTA